MKTLTRRINKIAILGKGTAGCIAASYFRDTTNTEIEWIYDSSKPAQSVGEGSTLPLGRSFWKELGMGYRTLDALGGSIKKGIRKINYQGIGDFLHEFPLGEHAIHFSSKMLQDYVPQVLEKKGVEVTDKTINNHDEVDADYIIDCTGVPSDWDDYETAEFISVNSVHIVQSPCKGPLFDFTFAVARPFGWVFAIPLGQRVSCGYLYNNTISTLEEVEKDMKAFMQEFRFDYSDQVNNFSFKNYYKKNNFTERVTYNGNASFFLEPMEASSVGTIDFVNRTLTQIINNDLDFTSANAFLRKQIKETEHMIMLHYLNGSKFDTPFWKYSKERAELSLEDMVKSNRFRDIGSNALKNFNDPKFTDMVGAEYGQWPAFSYYQNFKGLNIAQIVDNAIRKAETGI